MRPIPLAVPGPRARRRGLALAPIVALAVAACGTPAPDEDFVSGPYSRPVAAPAEDPASTPRDAAVRTPEPERPDPAVLRGLSGDQVTRLIGRPRFRRAEDPAALWRYMSEGCVLELYMKADGPVYRVVHFEFRRDTGAQGGIDARACFGRLSQGAAETPG